MRWANVTGCIFCTANLEIHLDKCISSYILEYAKKIFFRQKKSRDLFPSFYLLYNYTFSLSVQWRKSLIIYCMKYVKIHFSLCIFKSWKWNIYQSDSLLSLPCKCFTLHIFSSVCPPLLSPGEWIFCRYNANLILTLFSCANPIVGA